jgi:hypothetical protein
VAFICHPSHFGSVNRGVAVQDGLGIKQDPILKIAKANRAGGMAQVVKSLHSKCKVLTLNSNATKRKKERKGFFSF